jgi:hypothetical protein
MSAMLLVLITGCGDDASGPATPRIDLVASVALDATSSQLYKRESRQLAATFRASNGNVVPNVDGEVWTSSDANIVHVDQDGLIEGTGLGGPVTITVTANGHTASATVTVIPANVAIAATDSTLTVGQVVQLTGTAVDIENAAIAGTTVRWTSSAPSIAAVDENSGVLTGIAHGAATITATSAGRSSTMVAEVGVPTQWDGSWAGVLPAAESSSRTVLVRFDVVFGEVRSFRLTLQGKGLTCGAIRVDAVGPPKVDATSASFSLTVVPQARPTRTPQSPGTVTATFTDASALTGSHSDFSFGDVDCPPSPSGGSFPPVLAGSVTASTLTAARQ